jgi:hypothetical protein
MHNNILGIIIYLLHSRTSFVYEYTFYLLFHTNASGINF